MTLHMVGGRNYDAAYGGGAELVNSPFVRHQAGTEMMKNKILKD